MGRPSNTSLGERSEERSDQLEEARQLYLFGPPGGSPMRTAAELSRMTALPVTVLNNMIPAWKVELRQRSAAISSVYGNATDPDTLAEHTADVEMIRQQLTLARAAVPEELRKAGGDQQNGRYVSAMEFFLEMKKRWDALSGVTVALRLSERASNLAIDELVRTSPIRIANGHEVHEDPAFQSVDGEDEQPE